MNKLQLSVLSIFSILSQTACTKDETPRIPIRTYTVDLSTQPTNASFSSIDTNKKVFLSLSQGRSYNIAAAGLNAELVDLAIYDGTTTTTSIDNIHFVSIGGGTLSLNTAPSVYLYRALGTTAESTQYFMLTNMETWSKYNMTKIRDESGMNGLTSADFDNIQYVDEYQTAINQIQQPGTDNSNVAKKLINTTNDTLISKIWYFEFQSGGGTKTALAKITDFKSKPNGYITMQVKLLE